MEVTAELSYALNTFYFLVCGALVMWMAAGFAMLEAGLVRSKNTTEILTKNIVLFAIACTMYMLVGYEIMYPSLSNYMLDGITAENLDKLRRLPISSSVVFVATAMSIVSVGGERFLCLLADRVIYPLEGNWTWGGDLYLVYTLGDLGFSDLRSGIVHMAGAGLRVFSHRCS